MSEANSPLDRAREEMRRVEAELEEAEIERIAAQKALGWDEKMCQYRAPTSALDMGRVFGSNNGTLVWVDARELPELVPVYESFIRRGETIEPPAPGERFVFGLSHPVANGAGEIMPRYIAVGVDNSGVYRLYGTERGSLEGDVVACALMLMTVTVNARLFPLAVSSQRTPRFDGERKRRHPPSVVSIRLRPRVPEGATQAASSREYQHRWEVRGHWRMQPCGPGRSERRRIWVDAHEKGPEDAPKLEHQKVYVL